METQLVVLSPLPISRALADRLDRLVAQWRAQRQWSRVSRSEVLRHLLDDALSRAEAGVSFDTASSTTD